MSGQPVYTVDAIVKLSKEKPALGRNFQLYKKLAQLCIDYPDNKSACDVYKQLKDNHEKHMVKNIRHARMNEGADGKAAGM